METKQTLQRADEKKEAGAAITLPHYQQLNLAGFFCGLLLLRTALGHRRDFNLVLLGY